LILIYEEITRLQFLRQLETVPIVGGINPRFSTPRGIKIGILQLFLFLAASSTIAADTDQIRQLLQKNTIDTRYTNSPRPVRQWELERFYASREYRPIWEYGDRLEQLRRAITQLRGDGLDPDNYLVPSQLTITTPLNEVVATAIWLQATIDLQFGLLSRSNIEPIWHYVDSDRGQARQALIKSMLMKIDDAEKAITSARPTSPGYQALRNAYLGLLAQSDQRPWPMLPEGKTLRPGDSSFRVSVLRERLIGEGATFKPRFDRSVFDKELSDAVKHFQFHHSLEVDGLVGKETLAALNTPRETRLGQLRANLERWRWREAEMEDTMLIVNIAGAYLRYQIDGHQVWQTRTLVGKNSRPTPALKSVVNYLTFNPDWTIPPTILKEDTLPEIRKNPNYLSRHHIKVISYNGQPVDPTIVDWANPSGILLRQSPGPRNPLGRVAIRFPNPFSVYLHDTPNKRLFGQTRRAGSSGCVRVEGAVNLTYMLIEQAGSQTPSEVDKLFSSGLKRNVRLVNGIPLLMDYWTVDVDDAGRVIYQPDIYQLDAALSKALEE
jgi:murein L,D-transpeptidase YcbB/YkuD